MPTNELKITGRVLVTHTNGRTGDTVVDQQQEVTLALDLEPLLGVIHEAIKLLDSKLQPVMSPNTGNDEHHVSSNGRHHEPASV